MKFVDALYTQQIADAIRVRHLATELEEVWSVRPDQSALDACRELDKRQFDQAPVLQDGRVVGVVIRREMRPRGSVAPYVHHLRAGSLVAADVALRELMRYLQEEPFLLVLEGRTISGLVTAADLGRPAARTYFYLLLAQLEIALAELVRHRFPEQNRAVALLNCRSRTRHAELVAELRRHDEFIDDVAALFLTDLLVVVSRTPDLAHHFAGVGKWGNLIRGVGQFRNAVMHPVREFHEASREGLRKLVDYDDHLRRLIDDASHCLEALSTEQIGVIVADVPAKA